MKDSANSLWASVAPPMKYTTPALTESLNTDVVIIGVGFCGLSAAIHLAQQGVSVVCLEAEQVGWGASGRNNGQVIPGLKRDPCEVYELLGRESGEKLLSASACAPELVFSLIKQFNIHCDAIHKGWIQPARSGKALEMIASRVAQWQQFGAPVSMLDENELLKRLGTNWYRGAWLDARGGSLNPLAYARGLADAAIGLGVKLFAGTRVTDYHRASSTATRGGLPGWQVNTVNGSVTASHLLLCTNAYGEVNKALRRSIVPVRTGQIASAPLSEAHYQRILPKGEAASDASRILTSFRISPDKRLVMGGAFATGGMESSLMFERLVSAAHDRFPFLGKLQVEFAWSGYLAITKNHLPHIFELATHCFAPVGCNGRGIAMSTVTGKVLAELLCNENRRDCLIPVSQADPFIFHDFRNIGISASVAWNGLLDELEDQAIQA